MRRFRGIASAVFVCAAGCGKDHPLVDAPTSDGKTVDANTTADAATDVVVTTYSRNGVHPSGTLEASIPVVAVQPDGSLGPKGTTGADGTVTLAGVQVGASVSAIYPVTGGYVITTMMGVKPGDHITFGERFTEQQVAANNGTLTIQFPAVTGATSYEASWNCPGGTSIAAPATSIDVPESCVLAKVNVVLFARDGNGKIIGTGVLKDVAFDATHTVTLAAWTATTPDNFAESITGLAAEVTTAVLGADFVVDNGYESMNDWSFYTPANNAAQATYTMGHGGDRLYAWAQLMQNGGTVGRLEAYQALANDAAGAAFTSPAIPWLQTNTTFDVGSKQIAWTTVGTGAYDATVITASWSRTDAQQVTTSYQWIAAAPSGLSSLSWANAPADVGDYLPGGTDTPGMNVMLVDLSNADSFDQLRATPEWQWSTPGRATARGELTGVSSASFDGAEGNVPPIVRHPAR